MSRSRGGRRMVAVAVAAKGTRRKSRQRSLKNRMVWPPGEALSISLLFLLLSLDLTAICRWLCLFFLFTADSDGRNAGGQSSDEEDEDDDEAVKLESDVLSTLVRLPGGWLCLAESWMSFSAAAFLHACMTAYVCDQVEVAADATDKS
ncbi:hypothetical protein GW17_00009193 [Ensete ventricosum]|uniref:Uncharacterized protein n=1 Tax=Ensete ventricosum TaxID=4639 RepID=A0A444FUW9_ENSVE|nr:hypothetical protein B296_00027895 [Ensete ventricosum]RWW26417.1 hypothetical protein GW17_00009193 [Ensete ventricosum]